MTDAAGPGRWERVLPPVAAVAGLLFIPLSGLAGCCVVTRFLLALADWLTGEGAGNLIALGQDPKAWTAALTVLPWCALVRPSPSVISPG